MVLLYLPHVNLGPDLSVGWIWINTLTTLVNPGHFGHSGRRLNDKNILKTPQRANLENCD